MDLLDRMVEQGEDWLMLTMRRLDHFERTGLAPKDYSTWCEHALSGAYDWIDHDRLGVAGSSAPNSGAPAARAGATPEWLAGGRNGTQRPEDNPTAPVPSVAPRFGDSGYYGPNANRNGQGQPQQPQQAQQPAQEESDTKGRNIFRIFTN